MKIRDTQGNLSQYGVQGALDIGFFGDGSDLSPGLNGTTTNGFSNLTNSGANGIYTLTRSVFCTDLTVNSGITLKTAGFKIFCKGTLLNNGTITNAGTSGGNGASGGTAGTGGAALGATELGGSGTGGTGGAGAVGTGGVGGTGGSIDTSMGALGYAGGTGGNGTGANVGGAAGMGGSLTSIRVLRRVTCHLIAGVSLINGGAGAGGGGAGAGTASTAGPGGGGAGSGGGVMMIFAAGLNNGSGTITVAGGAGGIGGAGAASGCGGGGGGSGGGGGLLYLVYNYMVPGTITAWVVPQARGVPGMERVRLAIMEPPAPAAPSFATMDSSRRGSSRVRGTAGPHR